MSLRKEQAAFAAALTLVGLLAWREFSSSSNAGGLRGQRGEHPELERHMAPDLGLVRGEAPALSRKRDLFSAPRNTRPLPALPLVELRHAPLEPLLPPPTPGPMVTLFGRLLRAPLRPLEAPELFAGPQFGPELMGGAELVDEFAQQDSELRQQPGDVVLPAAGAKPQDAGFVSLQDRAAQIESYKSLYDWILISEVEYHFGNIENADPFGLFSGLRANEALLFTERNPADGKERFPGQGAIKYERTRISGFDFADTVSNRLEVQLRQVPVPITRSSFAPALAFADECVRLRLQAPRALEIARQLYQRLAAFDEQDPEPRLGLARCFEAGFDYGSAHAEYLRLLERFGHRPEVHARLGELYAKVLLYEKAEESFLAALQREGNNFQANWSYGRFLLEQGRPDRALSALEIANRRAPDEPSQIATRVAVRCDLGAALVNTGRLDEARATFAQARLADAGNERALAGLAACDRLQGIAPAALAANKEGERALGFDGLLSAGLASLAADALPRALAELERAAAADPLRANEALRALSHLAERAGFADEALRFVEEALEASPHDAWSLYQRGRLLALRDDSAGARASFESALALELDFEDALAALGELHYAAGRTLEARRYLERALGLSPERVELWSLYGWNELRAGALLDARQAFARAAELQPDAAEALAGLAWCTYLEGNAGEALIQLATLEDRRRNQGEKDSAREWAHQQIERIKEHLAKVIWTDNFERSQLKNGWLVEESAGPTVSLREGGVLLEGAFNQQGGLARVMREYPASLFVSIEASVTISGDSAVRVGLFVARERDRQGQRDIQSEVRVSRHKDGQAQVRMLKSNDNTQADLDLAADFPVGRPVRLRIEISGSSNEAGVSVWIDGVPVRERVSMPGLSRASTPLRVGLFAEGDTGRRVSVRMDDVDVVVRQ